MPNPPRAVVLSFERLSRRCLGCYGHEWIETPNLDRLASRAVVFDQHFVSPALLESSDLADSICDRLIAAGVEARTLAVPPSEAQSHSLDDLPLARLIAAAETELKHRAASAGPWLLWLQSQDIDWPCVALDTFAELYADELELDDEAADPDPIREAEVAYAACVTQLDHLVGWLLTSLDRIFGNQPPLLIVTAWQGESLGESEPLPLSHVSTSPPDDSSSLRDELLHTPLLIANGGSNGESSRRQDLTSAEDLLATLCDWFGQTVERTGEGRSLLPLIRNELVEWRDSLVLRDAAGAVAFRTNDYLVIRPIPSAATPPRLFLKPEDVWELNDVAEQNEELVAQLLGEMDHFAADRRVE